MFTGKIPRLSSLTGESVNGSMYKSDISSQQFLAEGLAKTNKDSGRRSGRPGGQTLSFDGSSSANPQERYEASFVADQQILPEAER